MPTIREIITCPIEDTKLAYSKLFTHRHPSKLDDRSASRELDFYIEELITKEAPFTEYHLESINFRTIITSLPYGKACGYDGMSN